MYVTINRRDRDAIYDGLMTDLTAIGDIFSHLHLRVNSRSEVLPTYRVGAPTVCAQTSSVDSSRLRLNRRARVEALLQALADSP
jgi:hypothetical protein